MINKALKKRILDITYARKISHLSSTLGAVDLIMDIYKEKLPKDKFVLSCGHAGLALYVVLEYLTEGIVDAEYLLDKCGIHPDRLVADQYIDCSTGSLGQGLPIAVGMALADTTRTVYVLVSDGEMAEGSCYEALNIINDLDIKNIRVYCLINGQGAYRTFDKDKLANKTHAMWPFVNIVYTGVNGYPHLDTMGLLAHYKVLDALEYSDLLEYLKR